MILLNKFIISLLYLIFPTFLMGMVFPAIIVMAIEKIEHLPEKIGTIYALDVFGAVSGALISGFLVIPFWGIKMLIFHLLFSISSSASWSFFKKQKFKWIILFLWP